MPQWPHDDTSSLIAFYGDPREPGFQNNLVVVVPPWHMTYEGHPIKGVRVHKKCAASLEAVFNDIWFQVGRDASRLPEGALRFSGSYNFRPVRGSSRMSCHAFGAAIDMDAEHNQMNRTHSRGTMSTIVIDAFKRQGWYWGGDFHSRQDPMHFQAAHENSIVTEASFGDEEQPVCDCAFNSASVVMDGDVPAENTPTISANGAENTQPVPSMVNSKTGWASIGIGSGGLVTGMQQFNDVAAQVNMAKWNAQQLGVGDLLLRLVENPIFMVAAVTVAAAVFVWFDHRKYKRLLHASTSNHSVVP